MGRVAAGTLVCMVAGGILVDSELGGLLICTVVGNIYMVSGVGGTIVSIVIGGILAGRVNLHYSNPNDVLYHSSHTPIVYYGGAVARRRVASCHPAPAAPPRADLGFP